MKLKPFYIFIIFALLLNSVIPSFSVHAATRAIEIVSERSDTTRTFRNTDLSETVDVFPYPVFSKDATGNYQPLDLSGNNPPFISYISESDSSTNFSTENQIRIGSDDNGEFRTFIGFGDHLPNIDSKLLTGATFMLYELDNVNSPGYYSPMYKNEDYSIHQIISDWNASTLTWENQPEFNPVAATSITDSIYQDGPRFSWTVTDLVKEWYNSPGSNHGIVLKKSDGQSNHNLRSFYKSDNNLNIIPVLQIHYSNPATGLSAIGYGLGNNSQSGYINLQWHPVIGAKGYKVLMFNGKEYEAIDVGTSTSWSTLGKNLWPTAAQLEEGEYHLRLDGTGGNLSDQPSNVYENAGATTKDEDRYYFKILAYNDIDSVVSEEFSTMVPDQTAPSIPTNLRVTNELYNDFTIEWNEATDEGSGVRGYDIVVTSDSGWTYHTTSYTNKVVIPQDRLSLRVPYTIAVRARDNYYSSGGNYSAFSEQIVAQARLAQDSLFLNYTIPRQNPINFDPYIRITVRNEGVEDWSNENGYELRADGIEFVEPFKDGEIVKSGEQKTFEFYLAGDKPLGETNVKWQMYHKDTGNFGDYIETTLSFVDMTSPEAIITSPSQYEVISGEVPVTGIITDYQLSEYKLSFGEGNTPSVWTEIPNQGTGERLGIWNTKGLPAGLYTLRLEAEDTSGNKTIIERKVFVNIPPASPTVFTVADHSTSINGMAQAGTIIRVSKQGLLIGTGITDGNGSFSVTIPKQPAGTILQVTASDAVENSSIPTSITVVDKTPPAAPTVNTVSNASTSVTGTGERGAKVQVYKGSSILGTGLVNSTGAFAVTISKQATNTVLTVKLADSAGNVSSGTSKTVIDTIPPAAPTVNAIADNSKTVSGTSEKNVTVKVKRGSTVLGSGIVNSYGKFSISIPLQKAGTELTIIAIDKAGNTSKATKKTVIDKTAPSITSVNTLYSSHKYVKGKAEPYSTITVKKGTTTLGSAQTNSKGIFTVSIKAQKKGTKIVLTAKDKAGNISKPKEITVK